MSKIAIMLGGNLPDTPEKMDFALEKLQNSGFTIDKISKIFHSEAVDCVPDTPDFLDRAVTGEWKNSAEELLRLCQSIEVEAGRPAMHSTHTFLVMDISNGRTSFPSTISTTFPLLSPSVAIRNVLPLSTYS